MEHVLLRYTFASHSTTEDRRPMRRPIGGNEVLSLVANIIIHPSERDCEIAERDDTKNIVIMSIEKKKETWRWIINLIVSVLTALAAALGANSCIAVYC